MKLVFVLLLEPNSNGRGRRKEGTRNCDGMRSKTTSVYQLSRWDVPWDDEIGPQHSARIPVGSVSKSTIVSGSDTLIRRYAVGKVILRPGRALPPSCACRSEHSAQENVRLSLCFRKWQPVCKAFSAKHHFSLIPFRFGSLPRSTDTAPFEPMAGHKMRSYGVLMNPFQANEQEVSDWMNCALQFSGRLPAKVKRQAARKAAKKKP